MNPNLTTDGQIASVASVAQLIWAAYWSESLWSCLAEDQMMREALLVSLNRHWRDQSSVVMLIHFPLQIGIDSYSVETSSTSPKTIGACFNFSVWTMNLYPSCPNDQLGSNNYIPSIEVQMAIRMPSDLFLLVKAFIDTRGFDLLVFTDKLIASWGHDSMLTLFECWTYIEHLLVLYLISSLYALWNLDIPLCHWTGPIFIVIVQDFILSNLLFWWLSYFTILLYIL